MLDVDVWLVGATVKVDDVDLAVLLRAVEAAVAELELLAIRYCLDGRFYVMGGRRVEGPTEPRPRFQISRPCDVRGNRQNDQITGTSSTATAPNRMSRGARASSSPRTVPAGTHDDQICGRRNRRQESGG